MLRLSPALPLQFARPARAAATTTVAPAATAASTPERTPDPAFDDWQDLLGAVTDRLRHLVDMPEALDCAAALDQLKSTLEQAIGRCQQQRLEAQAALAKVLDEVAGSRDEQPFVRHLTLHDSVTALPEHHHFRQRLDQAVRDAGSKPTALAVLYLGLAGIKAAENGNGPDGGDELLWAVGARLARAVRSDDLVSHFGQDEFAILLVGVAGRERLIELTAKLFETLSAPFQIGARVVCLRPSIGIAMAAADGSGTDGAALLSRADAAMVRARRHGWSHAFFGDRVT